MIFVVASVARAGFLGTPVTVAHVGGGVGSSSQQRSQDGAGNYNFNYKESHGTGGSFRQESGDASGRVTGSYGFTGADGRRRVVNYVADAAGFRASVSTNEAGTAPSSPAAAGINAPVAPVPVHAPVAPYVPSPQVAAAAFPGAYGPAVPAAVAVAPVSGSYSTSISQGGGSAQVSVNHGGAGVTGRFGGGGASYSTSVSHAAGAGGFYGSRGAAPPVVGVGVGSFGAPLTYSTSAGHGAGFGAFPGVATFGHGGAAGSVVAAGAAGVPLSYSTSVSHAGGFAKHEVPHYKVFG